ncbi:MAG: hypothetical protein IKQ49_01160 [Eubacterium sp.]|nr:hypothetical protein [Eubacterium sp.]MBR6171766.1 hypothetical protein [Eubacterium sp.]
MRSWFGGKKKRYRFSDDVIASDTKISFCFTLLSLLITVVTIVFSAFNGGNLPDRAGVLLLISLIAAFTGLCFGGIAYRSAEGDNNAKRFSVLLSLVALALILFLYLI